MNVSISLTGNSGLSSRLALFYKPLIINNLKFPNTLLEMENTDLRTRLAQSSANSHKPPSSDGLIKEPLIKPALPKQAGKKPGG